MAFAVVVTVGVQASAVSAVGVGVGVSDTGAMPVNVGVGVSVSIADDGSVVAAPDGRLQLIIASQMARIEKNNLFLSIVSPLRRLSIE